MPACTICLSGLDALVHDSQLLWLLAFQIMVISCYVFFLQQSVSCFQVLSFQVSFSLQHFQKIIHFINLLWIKILNKLESSCMGFQHSSPKFHAQLILKSPSQFNPILLRAWCSLVLYLHSSFYKKILATLPSLLLGQHVLHELIMGGGAFSFLLFFLMSMLQNTHWMGACCHQ